MVPEPYLNEICKLLRAILESRPGAAISVATDVERLAILHDHLGDGAFPNRFNQLLATLKQRAESLGQPQNHAALLQIVKSMLALIDTKLLIESIERDTAGSVEFAPKFDVSSEDRAKMLGLCQQMRDIANASKVLDAAWRRRLIKRVAAMELEINREKGSLDVLLAGMAETGAALGQFGKDIKPLVDRAREITGIAWPTSEDHKALPKPDAPKQLPKPDDEQA